MRLKDIFSVEKPIIAMLHLKGDSPEDIFERAKKEADLLIECGIDALMVEDYYGSEHDVERVLKWLQEQRRDYCYGVNVLDQFSKSYELAEKYGAKFMQIDSVSGHLSPDEDEEYGEMCANYYSKSGVFIMGGVRFKYKDVLSGRSLKEDLELGMKRCDAIVVTGEGTGMDTDIKKIKEFRDIIGEFPLIVGAGLTPETVKEQLSIGDGGIVGSTLKVNGVAEEELSRENILNFMKSVKDLRGI